MTLIEIDSKFEILVSAVIFTSIFLMLFTFLGIALNGQKVWKEPNDLILYTEIFLFLISFIYLIWDIFT